MLMTSNQPEWKLSDLSLNDIESLPGKTFEMFYDSSWSSSEFGYVLYSDQADQITFDKGHAKGVLIFNEVSAVWIVHSIPHYPPKPSEKQYYIKPGQCVYGQSMLCMSFSIDQLETIGNQLLYSYPQVYDFHIPETLKNSLVNELEPLMRVIKGEHVDAAPWSSVKSLVTIGGQEMLSFAKYTNFEDDLYAALVAPTLKSHIFTETWNNGIGTMPSNCTSLLPYHVMNIQEIDLEFMELFRFSVHQDHSKWVVTNSEDHLPYFYDSIKIKINEHELVKVACVGDINRQYDQLKRGGGTVCFMKNEQVWQQYHKIVSNIEECDRFRIRKGLKYKKLKSMSTNEAIIML
jgi:deoxyribonuclease-2